MADSPRMFLALALIATVAVMGWIALQQLLGPGRRRGSLPLALVALSVASFAAGDLLLAVARSPEQRALARAILFLGPCVLGPSGVWLAARVAQPRWWAA